MAAPDRTIADLTIATVMQHDDWLHILRPSEATVANQDKRIQRTTFDQTLAWTLLRTAAYTATPPAVSYLSSAFAAIDAWVADTVQTLGSFRRPTVANGYVYECVARTGDFKTHATTEPTWGTTLGGDTVDDAVTWRCRGTNVIATIEDLSSVIQAGCPLRYVWGGTSYYGICIGVSAAYIAVAGAPLSTTTALTALYYGRRFRVVQVPLWTAGDYDAGSGTDIAPTPRFVWQLGKAYLVRYVVRHETDDATLNPYVNIRVNGSDVAKDALQVTTSFQGNSPVSIDTATYDINPDEGLAMRLVTAGTAGAAAGLSAHAVFVLE